MEPIEDASMAKQINNANEFLRICLKCDKGTFL